jgi:hypothetical protein
MKGVITIKNNYNEFADIFLFGGGRGVDNRLDQFRIRLSENFRYHCMEKEINGVSRSLLTLSKVFFQPMISSTLKTEWHHIKKP